MLRSALVLVGTATFVAAADLGHKAVTETTALHERSLVYVACVAAASAVWAVGILLTRSTAIAFGGGVLLGGAAGNLLSLAFWAGVPNPIVVEPIAFNLADVFVFGGFGLVCAASVGFASANRERLRDPLRLR